MYDSPSERRSAFEIHLISPDSAPVEVKRYHNINGLLGTIVMLCFSTFYFGYSLVYFSGVPMETLIKTFGSYVDTTSGKAVLLGSPTLGAAVGALLAPLLMKYFSRKNFVLLISACAFVVGLVIQIPNLYVLIICRILQGVCFGQYMAIIPIYIYELCPQQLAGQLGVLTQLFVVVGVVTAYLVSVILHQSHAIPQVQWRVQFVLTEFTILLQSLFFFIGIIPESPNSYLRSNMGEAARNVIGMFHKEEFIDEIVKQKSMQIALEDTVDKEAIETPQVSNKTPWKALLIGFELPLMQQMTGVNAIGTQAGPIISAFSTSLAIYTPLIIQVVQLFATTIPIFILMKVGRKPLMLFGNGSLAIVDLVMALCLLFASWRPSEYIMLAFLILFQFCYAISIGPLVWLYVPEILPAKLVPFATVTNWLGCTLCIVLVPIVSADFNGEPYPAFFFFSALSFMFFFVNFFGMVETKGKSQAEIMKEYQKQY